MAETENQQSPRHVSKKDVVDAILELQEGSGSSVTKIRHFLLLKAAHLRAMEPTALGTDIKLATAKALQDGDLQKRVGKDGEIKFRVTVDMDTGSKRNRKPKAAAVLKKKGSKTKKYSKAKKAKKSKYSKAKKSKYSKSKKSKSSKRK